MATAVEGQIAPKPEEEEPNGVQALGALGMKDSPYEPPPTGGAELPKTEGRTVAGVLPAAGGTSGPIGGVITPTDTGNGPPGYQAYEPATPDDPRLGGGSAGGAPYQPGRGFGAGYSDGYGTGALGGGGRGAGGQYTLQPGAFEIPDIAHGGSSMGGAFDDPNAQNIYGVINRQINHRADWEANRLGPAAQYGGAQISPMMMVGGAQLDTGSDLQYQGAQNAYSNRLAEQAAGMGPSVAGVAADQQREKNVAAQMAMLGSQRGAGSTATGLRAAQEAGAAGLREAAASGALGRSQEAMAASGQLGGALTGARGQTQTTSQTQATLAQQALLANQGQFGQASLQQAQLVQQAQLGNRDAINQLAIQQQQAELQARGMGNQAYTSGLGAYMMQNEQDIQHNIAYQQMLEQEQLQRYGIEQGVAVQQTGQVMQGVGAGASALGALVMMSDERAKRDVRPAAAKIRGFLDELIGDDPLAALCALGGDR